MEELTTDTLDMLLTAIEEHPVLSKLYVTLGKVRVEDSAVTVPLRSEHFPGGLVEVCLPLGEKETPTVALETLAHELDFWGELFERSFVPTIEA